MNPLLKRQSLSALTALTCLWITTGISQCESADADQDGFTTDQGDCNDQDATRYPGAPEQCDGGDHSCDGVPASLVSWYADADGDGFGAGSASPQRTCTAPAGMVAQDGDCDDSDVRRSPAALEQCDQQDNDCDLGVDEGLPAHVWRDADGDGFGSLTDVRCGTTSGYVARRGDCNDASAAVHPGAADALGDALDSDCGGADGAQPHVGLSSSSMPSLAAALSQATAGTTLWVGPGVYPETELSFAGRDIRLSSTDMAEKTVVDGQDQGRLFRFTQAETQAAVLDGFTLRHGRVQAGAGGAVLIQSSSPTLKNLIFSDNLAIGDSSETLPGAQGGALASFDGNPVLIQCRFERNRATGLEGSSCEDGCSVPGGQGGALLLQGGDVQVGASHFESNVAEESAFVGGGAIWAQEGQLTVRGSSFLKNTATTTGGALHLEKELLTLRWSVFEENQACRGGGVQLQNSTASVKHVSIRNNVAMCEGGALHSDDSTLEMTYSEILSNQAQGVAGGMYLFNLDSNERFDIHHTVIAQNVAPMGGGVMVHLVSGMFAHNLVAYNAAEEGGGVYFYRETTAVLSGNIFLSNYGYALYNDEQLGGMPVVVYNVLHSPQSVVSNMGELPASNHLLDPELIRFTPNRSVADDDLLLAPTSAAHDLGDPSVPDPDGSPSEPGLGGGPMGAGAYYRDSDADGLYDGWELRYLGHLNTLPNTDSDADGLTQATELAAGLYPTRSDSDLDGQADGVEFAAGSDGLDWYSRPAGQATAVVPTHFGTLQAAIDAGAQRVSIQLLPGTYPERLSVVGKSVDIQGSGARDAVMLEGEGTHRVMLGYWSSLSFSHLTLQNGACTRCVFPGGGAVAVQDSTLVMDDVRLTGNTSGDGGALFVTRGEARLTDVLFERNAAELTGGAAWGMEADLQLLGVDFFQNTAGIDTGALKVSLSQLQGSHVSFLENRAARDSGAFTALGDWMLEQTASVVLQHVEARGNVAGTSAAALFLQCVEGSLSQATITQNTAGIKLTAQTSKPFTLENAIIAYNQASNIVLETGYPSAFVVRSSNSYNPPGVTNTSGVTASASLTTLEPGFLSYSGGMPADPHLARTSPLVNQGASGTADADGSLADLGMFGGPDGDGWDRDMDGVPCWFWPGTRADAPASVQPTSFDADDLNSMVQ